MKRFVIKLLPISIAISFHGVITAQNATQNKDLGVIVITSGQPSSLPTQIPTTMETVTAKEILETINATDSEDALKYLPSLSVRKRYDGDYNHAVVASRASGSNNAARSAVYADGMPLSNFLGNDKFYAPRWGMVAPEEIERVDVMYGPFSAAYPGNSVGAVIDYVTRMPTKFEAHMKLGVSSQEFSNYGTNEKYGSSNGSVTLGSKEGNWSYWFHLSRKDVNSQPMVFVTGATSSTPDTAVSGAVPALDVTNANNAILGTTTQYHTIQDHAKIKVAYDFTSTVRATYTLGYWQNNSDGNFQSYLTNSAGASVYAPSGGATTGYISQGGLNYKISNNSFSASRESLTHFMHGLSLKSNTQEVFDWEVLGSLYAYQTDLNRSSGTNNGTTLFTGNGSVTDYGGTGFNNFALKGTYRPFGLKGEHIVDFGYQQDNYKLSILKNDTGATTWETASAGTLTSQSRGKSQLQSLYAQDAWKFAPAWKAVMGIRAEQWSTSNGLAYSSSSGGTTATYSDRVENYFSPKLALSHLISETLMLKASTGRAVRMPTVHELYGSTSAGSGSVTFLNDPNLRPEKSQTTELTAEKDLGHGILRATAFFENTRDAIASQISSSLTGSTTTYIQNIRRLESTGLEIAYTGQNFLKRGLDFASSLTYVDSRIKENDGYYAVAGDTIDKYQIRVPMWRANALANYHWDEKLNTSIGARYASSQYGRNDNSDINGFAMTGNSKLYVVDARMLYKVDKQWSVAAGIDNLNNYKYWNYHQYPMRTYHAELRWDL